MKKFLVLIIVSTLTLVVNSQIQVSTNNFVGIGAVTTPSANLDILGSVKISNTSEADINYYVGNTLWEAGINNSGIGIANQYYIYEFNAGYRMRIHRNGNIMLYTFPNDQVPWIFEKNGVDPCLYATSNYGILGKADKPLFQIYSNNIWLKTAWLSSDERLKTNVRNLRGSLQKIKAVRPVSYDLFQKFDLQKLDLLNNNPKDYKDSVKNFDKNLFINRNNQVNESNKNKIGFIAQDFKEIFPELVRLDSVTGLYGIDYIGMIPVLTNAINEQQIMIEKQDSIIQKQRKDLIIIINELEGIKRQINK